MYFDRLILAQASGYVKKDLVVEKGKMRYTETTRREETE